MKKIIPHKLYNWLRNYDKDSVCKYLENSTKNHIDDIAISLVNTMIAFKCDIELCTSIFDTLETLNFQDDDGNTPLINICGNKHKNFSSSLYIDLVIQYSDINIQNNVGNSALHVASGLNYEEAMEKLLDSGAKYHIKNMFGETAISNSSFIKEYLMRKKISNENLTIESSNIF